MNLCVGFRAAPLRAPHGAERAGHSPADKRHERARKSILLGAREHESLEPITIGGAAGRRQNKPNAHQRSNLRSFALICASKLEDQGLKRADQSATLLIEGVALAETAIGEDLTNLLQHANFRSLLVDQGAVATEPFLECENQRLRSVALVVRWDLQLPSLTRNLRGALNEREILVKAHHQATTRVRAQRAGRVMYNIISHNEDYVN